MIPRETANKFGPMLAKLREELGPHLGAGGGFCEILDGIAGLREKVEAQAKEIERLRERERAARIEAVEEFRERARGECYDDGGESGWLAHTIAKRIAALPALPEEP